jgi:hypothetical protein
VGIYLVFYLQEISVSPHPAKWPPPPQNTITPIGAYSTLRSDHSQFNGYTNISSLQVASRICRKGEFRRACRGNRVVQTPRPSIQQATGKAKALRNSSLPQKRHLWFAGISWGYAYPVCFAKFGICLSGDIFFSWLNVGSGCILQSCFC